MCLSMSLRICDTLVSLVTKDYYSGKLTTKTKLLIPLLSLTSDYEK